MNCKNCATILNPQSGYCHNCGGKVIEQRLTIKHLFQHYTETFFSFDNTFFKTILFLFKDPKDVIGSYVNGVRKKYMAPLAFFAIALTLSGVYLFIIKKYFPDFFEFTDSIYADDMSKEIGEKVTHFTTEFNSLLNFIYIPFLALISRIVFLKNKYNFTEHLVIYFYTMSLFSIFSVVVNLILLMFFTLDFIAVNGVIYALLFLYQCYVLKQVFVLSFKQLLLKFFIFSLLVFVVYVVLIILVVITIMTGIIDVESLKSQP